MLHPMHLVKGPATVVLASFPPPPAFDHCQHTNTEGKAWELSSRAVMSGRQRVDTQGGGGGVPNHYNSQIALTSPECIE